MSMIKTLAVAGGLLLLGAGTAAAQAAMRDCCADCPCCREMQANRTQSAQPAPQGDNHAGHQQDGQQPAQPQGQR